MFFLCFPARIMYSIPSSSAQRGRMRCNTTVWWHIFNIFPSGRKSPDYASSFGSSGVFTKSEPNTPSPPNILSLASSAPASAMFGTPPIDEGIELDETNDYFNEEGSSAKRRKVRLFTKYIDGTWWQTGPQWLLRKRLGCTVVLCK